MTYTLRFLPEVESDGVAAYLWYEQKSPGLGEEFCGHFIPEPMSSCGIPCCTPFST